MNMNDLMCNDKARKLLKTFLKLGNTAVKSNALLSLECYEQADILYSNEQQRTDDAYDDLRDILPNHKWEQRLDEAIDSSESDALNKYFERLMDKCKRSIEHHRDFKRFGIELERKLG